MSFLMKIPWAVPGNNIEMRSETTFKSTVVLNGTFSSFENSVDQQWIFGHPLCHQQNALWNASFLCHVVVIAAFLKTQFMNA